MRLTVSVDKLKEVMGDGAEELIVDRVARGLNLANKKQVVKLRLDRVLDGRTNSINRQLLAHLLILADEYGVDRKDVLMLGGVAVRSAAARAHRDVRGWAGAGDEGHGALRRSGDDVRVGFPRGAPFRAQNHTELRPASVCPIELAFNG